MKNVKHLPRPVITGLARKTSRNARHEVNPAGTKLLKRIMKNRGFTKSERNAIDWRAL